MNPPSAYFAYFANLACIYKGFLLRVFCHFAMFVKLLYAHHVHGGNKDIEYSVNMGLLFYTITKVKKKQPVVNLN